MEATKLFWNFIFSIDFLDMIGFLASIAMCIAVILGLILLVIYACNR